MAYPPGALRPAEAGDADRVARLLTEAFAVPPEPAPTAEEPNLRGRWVLDGPDGVDATAWSMDCPQWFNGQVVASRAVAGVAVASDRRGVGAGRALMAQLVQRNATEGAAVMALYPSTMGFYRSLGFEVAGTHVASRVDIADLPVLRPTATYVVDEPDVPPLAAVYETAVRDLAGPLARPDWWWRGRVLGGRHAGNRWTVVVRDGGDVAGYAVLSKTVALPGVAYYHDLVVHDAAWRSADAARELLAYLRGFVALGETIRWPSPPGDHWLHLLTGRGPAPDASTHPWMLRVLDVPAALSTRGWPVTAADDVVVEVTDELVSDNEGRWRLTIDAGRADVTRTDAAPQLVLGVGALAAAYTGWRTVSDLVRHGLAAVSDPALAGRLDSCFSARPWLGDRF